MLAGKAKSCCSGVRKISGSRPVRVASLTPEGSSGRLSKQSLGASPYQPQRGGTSKSLRPRPISWTESSRNRIESTKRRIKVRCYCICSENFSAERLPPRSKWLLADGGQVAQADLSMESVSAINTFSCRAYCQCFIGLLRHVESLQLRLSNFSVHHSTFAMRTLHTGGGASKTDSTLGVS